MKKSEWLSPVGYEHILLKDVYIFSYVKFRQGQCNLINYNYVFMMQESFKSTYKSKFLLHSIFTALAVL